MSKSSNTRRTIGLLFVFVACVALVCADLVVSSARSPQNSNTSDPQDETTRGAMMTSNSNSGNTNTNTSRSRRRSRRNRNRASANANANMSGGDMSGNANMSGDMSAGGQDANANMSGDASMTGNANMGGRRGRRRRGRRNRTIAPGSTEANTNMSGGMESSAPMPGSDGGSQTDLSGTYTGTVDYPEGGLNGPATIVVTGNQFTLTPDGGGTPVNGTVTAVTTRGYTGVTMMFGDRTQIPPTQSPPPLPAVSLRARMSGGRVTLMSVPGEKRQFSFAATGGSGSGRVRSRGRRRGRRAARAMSTDTDRSMDSGTAIKPPTKSTP